MFIDHIRRIKQKGVAEGRRLLWIFAYLWVLFGLFAVHRSIVLNEQNVFFHEGFAFINAWLLAKIMLVAETFRVADNLKDRPLIYPIVYRSGAFPIVLIAFYILEEIVVGMLHGKAFAASIPALGGGSLEGIIVVGMIMFVALMPFFALREIARDLGDDKLYEQFFLRRARYIPIER